MSTPNMSSSGIAVELPTNRQSRHWDRPVYDVHDPNYIPVLNERAEIRVDFSKPSFSALPSIPTPHESPAQVHLKRSKSGSAPETVVHGQTDSIASRRFNVPSRNVEPQELGKGHAPVSVTQRSIHSTEDDNTSSSELSSTVASTQLEANVFMIPGNTVPKKEDLQSPALPHSARSSISSVKRPMVPTSRFSQKQPSLPSIPAAVARSASPKLNSNTSTPELRSQSPQIFTSKSIPVIPIPPIPSPDISQSTHRSQTMKSTASERRARALHSHPYSNDMHSKPSSVVDEAEETPLIKQLTIPDSRPASIRSRSHSICSSLPATPAPTAPLPDLPPGAKRPPTRERPLEKSPLLNSQQNSPSLQPPSVPEKDHMEMSEFMKKERTTVFRRFDDVHIRLLLHLQDEITALEKELLESEKPGSKESENLMRRPNIMLELRKVLAEYDHLFANWSAMQANKASEGMREQLASWLQNPNGAVEAVSKGARADLEWLNTSNDLSAVSIDPEKPLGKSATTTSTQVSMAGPATQGASSGGIWALLGCASKRK